LIDLESARAASRAFGPAAPALLQRGFLFSKVQKAKNVEI
jgi:hypothetical protein